MKKEIEDDKIIDFKEAKLKLLTGGPTGSDDWLTKLEKGSIFLARQKSNKSLPLEKYFLVEHRVGLDGTKVTNLLIALPEGKQIDIWVPSVEFSRAVDLYTVLQVVEFEMEKEEEKEDEPK